MDEDMEEEPDEEAVDAVCRRPLGFLLLTWINLNPSMDK